jgi:hypothetical protein
MGWVCRCGEVLTFGEGDRVGATTRCEACGDVYITEEGAIRLCG